MMEIQKYPWPNLCRRWSYTLTPYKEPRSIGFEWPEIEGKIPSGLFKLIAARLLIEGERTAAPDWIRKQLKSFILPCGISFEEATKIAWAEASIPLDGKDPGAFFIEIGIRPDDMTSDGGEYVQGLEAESLAAIRNALRLAGLHTGVNFLFWIRNDRPMSIQGCSMGLPVYLVARKLGETQKKAGGRSWIPDDVYATGTLDTEGQLLPVGGLNQKLRSLDALGFSFFLYPINDSGGELLDGRAFGVGSIEEAFTLFHHHDVPSRLWMKLRRIPKDKKLFWEIIAIYKDQKLSEEALLCLREYALANGCLERVDISYVDDVCSFVDNFPNCGVWLLEPFSLEWAKQQEKTKGLYYLTQKQHSKCNHQGKTGEAEGWSLLASQWGSQNLEDFAKRLSHDLITQQDKYLFLNPSDEFLEEVDFLERVYKRTSASNTAMKLGEIYGTLGQNSAFCHNFDEADSFFKKSMDFFNGDRKGSFRRYTDMAYLAWDRGEARLAEEYVQLANKIFLEDPYVDRNGVFIKSLLARQAAESGKLEEGLLPDVRKKYPKPLAGGKIQIHKDYSHPWQLILWNLGRSKAVEEEERKGFLLSSCAVCLECLPEDFMNMEDKRHCNTLLPMALLPLSLLAREDQSFLKYAEKVLHSIQNANEQDLFKAHFRELFTLPTAEALELVQQKIALFFPFSYR